MQKTLLKCLALTLFVGLSTTVAAHRYFFGLTDLTVNPNSNKLEVMHQLTSHDVDNAIAELKQIHFSPEHQNYDLLIKEYIDSHFQLSINGQNIVLNWVGLEVKRGKLFIYQEVTFENFLSELVVKNRLLVDTYPRQVNTLNYQDTAIKGSLTFTESTEIAKIGDNIKHD